MPPIIGSVPRELVQTSILECLIHELSPSPTLGIVNTEGDQRSPAKLEAKFRRTTEGAWRPWLHPKIGANARSAANCSSGRLMELGSVKLDLGVRFGQREQLHGIGLDECDVRRGNAVHLSNELDWITICKCRRASALSCRKGYLHVAIEMVRLRGREERNARGAQ